MTNSFVYSRGWRLNTLAASNTTRGPSPRISTTPQHHLVSSRLVGNIDSRKFCSSCTNSVRPHGFRKRRVSTRLHQCKRWRFVVFGRERVIDGGEERTGAREAQRKSDWSCSPSLASRGYIDSLRRDRRWTRFPAFSKHTTSRSQGEFFFLRSNNLEHMLTLQFDLG